MLAQMLLQFMQIPLKHIHMLTHLSFLLCHKLRLQTVVKVTATRLGKGKSNKCNFMKEKDVGKCSLKAV